MKSILVLAALACSTGCASSHDRQDGAAISAAEGHPGAERHGAAGPKGRGKAAGDDDDPWWSSLAGDLCGGAIGALLSGDGASSTGGPDDPTHGERPFVPWSLDP